MDRPKVETTARFTPGPWNLSEEWDAHDPEIPRVCVFNLQGEFVHRRAVTDERVWPDARLIASAPELYEALLGMLYSIDGDGMEIVEGTYERARAALAKADGTGTSAEPTSSSSSKSSGSGD